MRARRSIPLSTIVIGALLAGAAAVATGATGTTAVAALPPAQLVLSVVGDGTAALAGVPTAVTLTTVNADGSASTTPTVSLPVAADGANQPFTLSGDSSAIGQLALSGDGLSLAIAGYAATPGQFATDPKDSTAAAAPRVVASIAADGTVDTSTVLTGALSADHPRSVVTADGQAFYVSGNGTAKTPAAGVVLAQRGSTAAPTAIAAAPILNSRNLAISGGVLYSSTGTAARGIYTVGTTPLPTAPVTAVKAITAPSGTAASFVMLDRDTTPGADTAYVIIEETGIYKFALDAGAWVAEGFVAGSYQAITGRVVGTSAELFAVKETSAGNSVVALTDAAASIAPIAASMPVTVATAAANTAFRGVALAPTGWDPEGDEPVVPAPAPSAVATPTAATTVVGGTLATTIASDVADAAFTVVSSSNPAVANLDDITLAGEGSSRVLSVATTGAGVTTVTVEVADTVAETSATATFTVGASGATPLLEGVEYHVGSADASTAIALDDDYMLVADDETNVIRLYARNASGAPLKTFEFPELGSKEVDLEASARVGDTIYWFASHGNNKDSEYKEARSVFFTTTVSGTGLDTELAYVGKYTGLRTDLLAWDAASSTPLGLGTACSLTVGTHPDQSTGCNVEGVEFTADGTTALVAFRSPRIDGEALIVPVTNATELVGGATAEFGEPILLDLGGRTFREIRSNGDGGYLITAGAPDDDSGLGWALYRWNGVASSDPVFVATLPSESGAAGQASGSYESIVAAPATLTVGSSVQLLTDNGTTVFYADRVEGKDVSPAELLKFRSNTVTIGADSVATATPSSATVVAGGLLTISGAGFTPGEDVATDVEGYESSPAVADAVGEVSAEITIDTALPAGTYTVGIEGERSGLRAVATVVVTAAPEDETPGTDEPGTDEPGTDEPGTDDPGTETPGTDEPGTETPGTDESGTDEPGTDEPGTDEPGTETPGTDDPDTETPGTDLPGTGTPADDTVTVSDATPVGGGDVTVGGEGFTPGELVEVWIHSDPILLDTVRANSDGSVSATVTIPATIEAGAHELHLVGVESARDILVAITVSAAAVVPSAVTPTAAQAALAYTGADLTVALPLALLLLAAGVLLVARRRATRRV